MKRRFYVNLFRPIIIGIHGVTLTESEKIWLPELRVYGVILFSRNVESPSQLRQLCDSIRDFLGHDVVIMIDQEGGRVQRLKDPHWPRLPSALQIGKLWRRHQFKGLEAANSLGQVIGSQLAEVGITHVAAPVLDLLIDGADPIIGDRSFGTTPAEVIPLATAFIDGLHRCGITAIVKHIPGMGRVDRDSHDSLPVISTPISALKESDWVPFRLVTGTHWAMTAHVVIPEWDKKPITQSEEGIRRIREMFGDRMIVSDCLTMGAIEGSIEERVRETLDAGVNLALFSNGSDNDRRRAVSASGEPRVTREYPLTLRHLPTMILQQLLEKLAKVDSDQRLPDPTWDLPN
ncbi:MAG TPA: beta-N-acetylhexosaminidase [Gammaproteobacteria bacterium]|nr:beta-N-acetylhexosaminidase [Gammaproteobacteria bacterium]